MFLARAAARHVLITAPSYSTSFDNEAGRSLRQKGLGPTFGCKVQEEERSVVGVGCGVTITHWCGRQGDVTPLRDFLSSFLLCCCQTLCSPTARMEDEMCNSGGDCHAHLCVGACASTPPPYRCTCLFVFLLFYSPHDIKTPAGKTVFASVRAAHERRQSGSGKYNSYVVQLGFRRECVCVCTRMCDWFQTSMGFRCFPSSSNTRT